MRTLLTLFGTERSELQTEINKATSLKQVSKVVQNRIDSLEKNYVGELSVTQVRLVKFFLETLRQSLSTLTAANEIEISDVEPQLVTQAVKSSPNNFILKLLQAIVSIGILVSLFSLTKTNLQAWMPILLMSVLLGLEAALHFDKSDRVTSPVPAIDPQLPVQVDSTVLLDNLAEALNTIDLAVASVEEVNKPLASSGLEDLTEILDILQRLMGASFLQNPLMALELVKLIPQILMKQGIRVQSYQLSNKEQSLREYFEFEPSIDATAKDYITVTPALLKGDRLLRRGRVIEPVDAKADN
ncbi:MAG TPA: hypothetical protein V6D09_02280 [Leptolyngbyaceae cyanobacterium]